jgi:hypothetical protein
MGGTLAHGVPLRRAADGGLGQHTEKEAERLCVSGSGAGRVVVEVDPWVADRAEVAPARFTW